MINAALYIRVSTEEQSRKGLSLESQEADLKEYCKNKGYRIYDTYIDRGITARKSLAKRTEFMRMMNDVQNKRVNRIIILRLDRFFRNVYDYHRMMNEFLIPNKCEWEAVKEDYNTSTTNGRLMINLRLAIAEQECDQDSDRIKDIMERKIKEGFVVSGNPPYGYKIENKRYVIDEETAENVKGIFDTYIRTNSVGKTLIEAREKYGKNLMYISMRRLLQNKIYIGQKCENTNYCEPIIDKQTFETVQEMMNRNIRYGAKRNVYLFSGIIRCPQCGHALVGQTCINKYGTVYPHYRCNNHVLEKRCTHKKHINEPKLEAYLLNNIDVELKKYSIKIKEMQNTPIKSNRLQIENKIARLNDLYINGLMDIETVKDKKAELESQIIEEAPKTYTVIPEDILADGITEIYADLTKEEKRSLWRSIIKSVTPKDDGTYDIIFL